MSTATATAATEEHPVFYGKPLIFYPNSHRYKYDGQWVPAVTTILNRLAKPALIQWAADQAVEHIIRECPRIDENVDQGEYRVFSDQLEAARKAHAKTRDAAGDVGTALHEYARARLAGEKVALPDADEPTQKVVAAFEEWRAGHEIIPLGLERRVYSLKHNFAGTCDFFGTIDGRLCVLDFKTGKAIYDEFWLQTAGYACALAEEHPHLRPMARWIVRLDKRSGEFEAVVKPPSAVFTDAWVRLVELDRFMRLFKKEAA
jgi:hypothetical protein